MCAGPQSARRIKSEGYMRSKKSLTLVVPAAIPAKTPTATLVAIPTPTSIAADIKDCT